MLKVSANRRRNNKARFSQIMNYRKIEKDLQPRKKIVAFFALSLSSIIPSQAQIAAWDFFGESNGAISSAEVFDSNLDSSSSITRGAGAAASAGNNSFRTTGFQNNGISVSNTDFFQITLSSDPGQTMSLSSIDARFAGTNTFAVSPGVSSQFAYSLDGTSFTLIGSPAITTGTPATLPQISLAGIPALQNVPAGTTVTLRYYASGQTTTGGWGFNSPAAGQYGLAIGGTFAPDGGGSDTTPPTITSLAPADDATNVNETANLVATFSEAIQKGTGNIVIKNSSDNSTVETLDVSSSAVTVSGTSLTIDPTFVLAFSTGYYVLIDSGAVRDNATTPNNFAGISTATTWNFTTRAAPQPNALFISQYYEGTSNNKFIELYNNGTSDVDLSTYSLTLWNNANAEGWKTGGSANATLLLTGTLAPGAHYLYYNSGALDPSYAVPGDVITGVTSFNGNDSVVLYNNTEIADAVSFTNTGNEGVDKSFYRLSFDQGYDTTAGSSVLTFPLVWGEKSLADVASAAPTDPWYLQRLTVPSTLTLSILPSSASENTPNAATATVTRSGSTVGTLAVEIAFNDPTEVEAPFSVEIPDGQASATFSINTLDDSVPDGNVVVTFTVSAPGFNGGTATFTVNDDGDVLPPAPVGLKINEIRIDDDNTDGFEYFEIYNTTNAPLSLNNVAYVVIGESTTTGSGAVESLTLLPNVTIAANSYYLVAKQTTLPIDRDSDSDQSVDFTTTPDLVEAAMNFENSDNVTHMLVYGYTGVTNSDIDDNNDGTPNITLPWISVLDAVSLVETVQTPGVAPATGDEYYYASLLGGTDIGPDTTFVPVHIYRDVDGTGTWTIGPFGTDQDILPGLDNSVLADVKDTPGRSNVVSLNNYSSWASTNGATNDALADHDLDGVKNGVEYFMGQTGSTFTSMPNVVNGAVTWSKDPTANATYVVKTSPNLIDWTTATGVVDNGTSVTFTLPTGQTKIFVRLEVTIP